MTVVLGVGEMLWDVFPTEKHLGGAPVNFVYHCRQLGLNALPVSRIGNDSLGREIRAILKSKEIPDEWVQVDDHRPTGTVKVTMSGTSHTFTITENVAWDYLESDEKLLSAAKKAAAVCFGTLAQRNTVSRETIQAVVKACPGLKVYDINLRQHFFSKEIIETSLTLADVLKLNSDELFSMRELLGLKGQTAEELCRQMLKKYELKVVCITRGADGAMLVSDREVAQTPGEKVTVVDTVGCGDAFCAAMVYGLLCEKPLATIVRDANRLGLFVAGRSGGTPEWTAELKKEMRGDRF